jgi:hypothetical protein
VLILPIFLDKILIMKTNHFHTSITVDATPEEAFQCINNVTKWWTENLEGASHQLNDEFTVQFGDVHYSKQRLVEFVPEKRVVWLITEGRLNFVKDQQEWVNHRIVFDILTEKNKTKVNFTQIGLVPEIECYEACSNAWNQYIQQSLYNLITKGKGQPEKKEVKKGKVYP